MFGLMLATQAAALPTYFPPEYARARVHCHLSGRVAPILTRDEGLAYGVELAAAGEPSLYRQAQAGNADALRFFRIGSRLGTVTVRIEGLATKRRPRLIATRLADWKSAAPTTVATRIDRSLTPRKAADFRRQIAVDHPLRLAPIACGPGGLDGSTWAIERAVGSRYRLVHRWQPKTGAVRTAGLAMLRLTGWSPDID